MTKKRKVSRGVKVISRRVTVLERLQNQLKSGTKNKRVVNDDEVVTLTDKDKTRILKEIEILKTRL